MFMSTIDDRDGQTYDLFSTSEPSAADRVFIVSSLMSGYLDGRCKSRNEWTAYPRVTTPKLTA